MRLDAGAGPTEQIVDGTAEPLDLIDGDVDFFGYDVEVIGFRDLLQAHEQRRERRAQLVGGIGREVPLSRQSSAHLLRTPRQRIAEAVHLDDP